jgi:AsmA protein
MGSHPVISLGRSVAHFNKIHFRQNIMRKVFFLFLGLILLVGAAVAAIVLFVPLDSLRAPLERAVSNALGREVHVAGGLHASLYPEIGLSASDVSIANVPGGQAAAFAHVGTLAVGAKLMPLFSREIDITTLTLEDPEIHLEVDKAGNANWNFHFAGSGGSSTQSSRLSVSGLKISNGTVSYFDARTGKQKILSAANVSFDLAALDQPAVFSVDATYNGEKLTATGRVDSPDSYTQKMPTKILLDLKSRLINLHFDGTVVGATQNDGTVAISGPSLRELIEGTGTQLKTGGLGPFSVAGAISTKNRIYALKDAKIALDDMHASVDLAVDMNGTVPSLKGNVALDKLNVGTYMIAGQPAPASPGWSTAPLSLSGLKEANADIAISVGNLTLGTFAISQGAMTVALQGGILTANLTKVGLFGGTASGRLVADGSGTVPVFALKSDVSGVAMQTLLQSAMKIKPYRRHRHTGDGCHRARRQPAGDHEQSARHGQRDGEERRHSGR